MGNRVPSRRMGFAAVILLLLTSSSSSHGEIFKGTPPRMVDKAPTPPVMPTATPIQAVKFGVNSHAGLLTPPIGADPGDTLLKRVANAKIQFVRMDLSWSYVEPRAKNKRYDFKVPDQEVREAARAGVEVLAGLQGFPYWSNSYAGYYDDKDTICEGSGKSLIYGPTIRCYKGRRNFDYTVDSTWARIPPEIRDDWDNFVRVVTERYSGDCVPFNTWESGCKSNPGAWEERLPRIKYWGPLNEANTSYALVSQPITDFLKDPKRPESDLKASPPAQSLLIEPDFDTHDDLLERAARIIHQRPGNLVVGPDLARDARFTQWITQLMLLHPPGSDAPIDRLSIHLYPEPQNAQDGGRVIEVLDQEVKKGLDKAQFVRLILLSSMCSSTHRSPFSFFCDALLSEVFGRRSQQKMENVTRRNRAVAFDLSKTPIWITEVGFNLKDTRVYYSGPGTPGLRPISFPGNQINPNFFEQVRQQKQASLIRSIFLEAGPSLRLRDFISRGVEAIFIYDLLSSEFGAEDSWSLWKGVSAIADKNSDDSWNSSTEPTPTLAWKALTALTSSLRADPLSSRNPCRLGGSVFTGAPSPIPFCVLKDLGSAYLPTGSWVSSDSRYPGVYIIRPVAGCPFGSIVSGPNCMLMDLRGEDLWEGFNYRIHYLGDRRLFGYDSPQ